MNKLTISLHSEAEHDVRQTYYYYEECSKGLGDEFVRSLDATFSLIQRNPEIFQIIYKNVRRGLIRRFPYGIFYIVEEKRIVVIAVMHLKRDIKHVKDRI